MKVQAIDLNDQGVNTLYFEYILQFYKLHWRIILR